MKKCIASLDQGTTSSRCIVFDLEGRRVASAQKELSLIYPHPAWVEQDPREIWASQLSVFTEALALGGIEPSAVAAIGIANQRETTIVWDRHTGEPVYNAIGWQCRRTADICAELIEKGFEERIRENTGLVIDAYFSASKVKWILDNVPKARERAEAGELLFGTVDTWLIWQLTHGKKHVTDYSNASRTMLFNIHTLEWDADILKILNIPKSMLPEVLPSAGFFGYAQADILGAELPVCGVAGDQQAALFGQHCFAPGMVKNTYGTGCFILVNAGETVPVSKNRLLSTIAWGAEGKVEYALEGSVFSGGAAIQWLRDGLKIIETAAQSEAIALSVPDSGGVYVIPAFTGIGAPHWDPYARGAILGLTRGSERAHIVRATLEAIAYQSMDVIQAMREDTSLPIREIRVDGGASANNFLMQFQADLLDAPVLRSANVESTAFGAACLAGLGAKLFRGKAELPALGEYTKFPSQMPENERAQKIEGWRRALRQVLNKET